jgi:hypothetical protein
MKLQTILPISAILVGAVALPSFAGETSVRNTYDLRSTFNGHSKTTIDVNEVYKGDRSASSYATKNGWTSTSVTENKDGRHFTEQDKFDISTTSNSHEKGTFVNTTNVKSEESYDFSGFSKDHKTASGYKF